MFFKTKTKILRLKIDFKFGEGGGSNFKYHNIISRGMKIQKFSEVAYVINEMK